MGLSWYRDLRERGYAVQTGPQDFRVFRRGQKPGSGQSQYMVRVLSERDLVDFPQMIRENDIIHPYAKTACPCHR